MRHNPAATREMRNPKRTKDLVLVNLVSGRAVIRLQAGIRIAPREFEGVRFVLELVTESVPREVIVGGEVEVGDADAALLRVDEWIVGLALSGVALTIFFGSCKSRVNGVESKGVNPSLFLSAL